MYTIREKNGIRAFWRPGRGEVRVEFYWWASSCAFVVEVDSEHLQLHVALPPFNLFLTASNALTYRFAKWALRGSYAGRSTGIRVFERAIWWDCWSKTDEWSSRDPKWMRWTWHPLDTFFGSMALTERPIGQVETLCQMPEKAYPVKVELQHSTWKRPRLPWASVKRIRAHIDVPNGGIPIPGKGENSWDCDQDAIHSMTCSADSVEKAIEQLRASAIRDRTRYGGAAWRPEAA